MTWDQLAREVGHNRATVLRWRSDLAGAPQTPDPQAWRDFIEVNELGRGKHNPVLNALRAEKLKEEIEGARLKNARLRGEMLPAVTVEGFVATLAQKWDLLLRQNLEVELGARCAGKDAAAINAEGSAILDEIRAVCERGLADWKSAAAANE